MVETWLSRYRLNGNSIIWILVQAVTRSYSWRLANCVRELRVSDILLLHVPCFPNGRTSLPPGLQWQRDELCSILILRWRLLLQGALMTVYPDISLSGLGPVPAVMDNRVSTIHHQSHELLRILRSVVTWVSRIILHELFALKVLWRPCLNSDENVLGCEVGLLGNHTKGSKSIIICR